MSTNAGLPPGESLRCTTQTPVLSLPLPTLCPGLSHSGGLRGDPNVTTQLGGTLTENHCAKDRQGPSPSCPLRPIVGLAVCCLPLGSALHLCSLLAQSEVFPSSFLRGELASKTTVSKLCLLIRCLPPSTTSQTLFLCRVPWVPVVLQAPLESLVMM